MRRREPLDIVRRESCTTFGVRRSTEVPSMRNALPNVLVDRFLAPGPSRAIDCLFGNRPLPWSDLVEPPVDPGLIQCLIPQVL